MRLIYLFVCFISFAVFAEIGVNIGFNNPSYTDTGVNFILFEQNYSIEVGFGKPQVGAVDDNAFGSVIGDIDIKYFFSRPLSPYVEAGLRTYYNFEGGVDPRFSFSSSSPFFGFGLAYINKVIIYGSISYNINIGDIYTAWGVGILL